MDRRNRRRLNGSDGSSNASPKRKRRHLSCLPPDVICSEILPHFRAEIIFGPAVHGELLFFSQLGDRVPEFCRSTEWSAPPYAYWRLEVCGESCFVARIGRHKFDPIYRLRHFSNRIESILKPIQTLLQHFPMEHALENVQPFSATGLFGYFKKDPLRYPWFLFRSVYIYRDQKMLFSPNIPMGSEFRGRFRYNLDSLQQVVVVRTKQLISLMLGSHLRGVIPEKLNPMPQLEFFSCHPRLISKCRNSELLRVPRLEILIATNERQQELQGVQPRFRELKWNAQHLRLRSTRLRPLHPTFFSGDMSTIRRLDLDHIVIDFPFPELPNLTHFVLIKSEFPSNRVFSKLKCSLKLFVTVPPEESRQLVLPPTQILGSLRFFVVWHDFPEIPIRFSTVFAETELRVLCVRSSSSLMDFADLRSRKLEILRLDLRHRDPKPTVTVRSLENLRILVLVNVVLQLLESRDGLLVRPKNRLEFLGMHEANVEAVLLPGNMVTELKIDAEECRDEMPSFYWRL